MNQDSGGSRAAKKRAKKKFKEQEEQKLNSMKPDVMTGPTDVPSSQKRMKMNPEPNEKSTRIRKSTHSKLVNFLTPYLPTAVNTDSNFHETIPMEEYARLIFEFILDPCHISVDEFYQHFWEKKPLLISQDINLADDNDEDDSLDDSAVVRDDTKKTRTPHFPSRLNDSIRKDTIKKREYEQRLNDIFSKRSMEDAMVSAALKDVQISRYHDDGDEIRQHEMKPDAMNRDECHSQILEKFQDGWTIRLNNTQTYSNEIYALMSILENEFGCRMEAFVDLTPGGTTANQGYAPHYDNTEAFHFVLEGRLHFRVYSPLKKLPRQGCNPFSETEESIIPGKPVIDVELSPGDMLYIPRGWVYQANTVHGGKETLCLSLHTMQHWSWCDFLDLLIPDAVEAAIESEASTLLRQGLPRNFLNYMGVMHEYRADQDFADGLRQAAQSHPDPEDSEAQQLKQLQEAFKSEAKKRIMRVCKEALDMITAGCDQMAKRFLSERLPPVISPTEVPEKRVKIKAQSMVRCIRKGAARIVLEDGKAVLYHCMDNARECQAEPLSPLEFEVDDGPALEALLTTTYPHWICVQDLNHGMIEDKIEITQSLYDEGLLQLRD